MIAQVSNWAEYTGIERGYNTTFEDELAVHIDPYRLIDRFEVEIAIWRRRVLLALSLVGLPMRYRRR